MVLLKKWVQAALLVLAMTIVASPFALAQNKTAAVANSAAPDPSANPVLAQLIKGGGKAYFLGTRSGLNGWFIVKNGQVQIAYTPPDNQSILIGAMFDADGDNISGHQVKTLVETNKEVAGLLNAAVQQQQEISKAGALTPAAASPVSGGMPAAALSPGERLYQQLETAPGVTVGATTAPLLLMVVDPNCPHCQATWRALRESVFKNELQIRLVPIGAENSDNERAAAQLLHVADPLKAWDKYVSGDKSQLAGTPDAVFVKAVHDNHVLTDNWNIEATPFLVYRGKDGKVKVEQGEPDNVAAVLNDLIKQGP